MDLTNANDLVAEHQDARHEQYYDQDGCTYPGCEEAFALLRSLDRLPD